MSGDRQILRPISAGEVSTMLAQAAAGGRSVEIRGGGSKVGVGPPEAADQILDLSALNGLESYEPGELVLRAGAGAPLAEIEALLAQHDQMLAFEPPDFGPLMGLEAGLGTLGGALAAGLSGPRRIAAGAARDHFLGFEAVAGRGVAFKAGGPVVKNVTGYDLPKLLAGSWGTLAALTSVTVKVMPRPRTAMTLAVGGLDVRAACAAMSRAMGGPWSVSGAAHLPASVAQRSPLVLETAATVLRLEGFSPSVQARAAALRTALRELGPVDLLGEAPTEDLWRWVRDVGAFVGDTRRVWRLSVPPADGWRLAVDLATLGGELVFDWAGGQVWFVADDDIQKELMVISAAAESLGGHAMLFRGTTAEREFVAPSLQLSGPLAGLSARVKAAFDPHGVLSPRRFAVPMTA